MLSLPYSAWQFDKESWGLTNCPRSAGRGPTALPQPEVLQDWKGLNDSHWTAQTKPSWLQGPFHQLCLPQLAATDFSHASTACQLKQLVDLCVVPVLPAKHQIKGIDDLMRLPSPTTSGTQPKLPLVRVPQKSCLIPSKLLVRRQESLACMESTGYWNLTLQISGSSCSTKLVRLHALICHARHGPPADPRLRAKHLCGNLPCIHPEHIAWGTQCDTILHACHKYRPMHFPKVAQNYQAKAEAGQAKALLFFAENAV